MNTTLDDTLAREAGETTLVRPEAANGTEARPRADDGLNAAQAAAASLSLPPEVRAAQELARRYRLPYIDLLPPEGDSPIDYALLGEIPVDLMLRHQFVPLRREGRRFHVAMADPSDLERLDELAQALRARIV
ncbi:MAG TPA: hypothetical protein VGA87_01460, partial [Pyrinomonadaceae bacterium]